MLTDVLSKYNDLQASAPNSIQRDKVEAQFRREFCAKIPKADVSGWIGSVGSIDDHGPDKSIRLDLSVHTIGLHSGGYGVQLSLGNYYAYGVSRDSIGPHEATEIPIGSPLYEAVSNFRSGDVIRFNATFIPYVTDQACYGNNTTYFALVHFKTIQKLGWDIDLQ